MPTRCWHLRSRLVHCVNVWDQMKATRWNKVEENKVTWMNPFNSLSEGIRVVLHLFKDHPHCRIPHDGLDFRIGHRLLPHFLRICWNCVLSGIAPSFSIVCFLKMLAEWHFCDFALTLSLWLIYIISCFDFLSKLLNFQKLGYVTKFEPVQELDHKKVGLHFY